MAWGKESRQARGYGAEWERARKAVMIRDAGLCQVCAKKGIYTPAHAVDHIVSKAKAAALQWSKERIDAHVNLQAICDPCHLIKTEEEQGKMKHEKVVIGEDGWPITTSSR